MMAQNFPPSARASATLDQGPAWTLMERVKSLPKYDAHKKPDGLINLSRALNGLMKDWMNAYTDKNLHFTSEVLSYGPLSGSQDLLSAAAAFFNHFFDPVEPVAAEQVLAANGVTSLLNMMAWTLCDEGDGVLYTTPGFYMLDFDLSVRTGLVTVPVSMTGLKDPFGADGLDEFIEALEAATDNARDKLNVKCRMLCLTNPSNPQGRWYSKETLEALASWCARRQMHLVIDEIYALSTFAKENGQGNPNGGGFAPMTSILSVSARENVHCLYGLSKDFNMGGVRMAFLVSRNTQVRAAVSKITWFTWLSVMSDKFVTGFLEQLDLVQQYLDVYRPRLANAYRQVTTALETHRIPFERAEAGLFVFIDLGAWINHFQDPAGKPPLESVPDRHTAHGKNGYEVALAVKAGLTPLQAIEAGTINSAETLGALAPKKGLIQKDWDADLIALEENPLDNIHLFDSAENIRYVWKGGLLVKSPQGQLLWPTPV